MPTVLVAIRDVSDRHAQSAELEAAKDRAEVLLAQAEQASQAKSDFLASMSHEIRTPLNSILGFTDLLLDDYDLPPEARRLLQQVQGSGTALLTVVNDILDFSKIEAGQIELDPKPTHIASLVENVISIIRGVATKKKLELQVSLDPDDPLHRGGRRRPPAAGAPEPRQQRRQVHGARPHRAAGPPPRLVGRRRADPVRGRGYRDRDPGRQAAPAVRAVQPGRQLDPAPFRRDRSRARHLQAADRAHAGNDRRQERGGVGLHLLVRADAAGRRGERTRFRRRRAQPRPPAGPSASSWSRTST